MKTDNTDNVLAVKLLKNQPIDIVDAARLVLEIMEELGTLPLPGDRHGRLKLLRRVLRAGVAAVLAEESTVSFEEAAWASVEARKGRREATKADLSYFVRRILRVEGVAARPLRAMTTRECRELLAKAFGSSIHCYRKGRSILHSIFAFGYRHEWCDANPVSRIEVPPVEEKEIVPLTPDEIKQLEHTASQPVFKDLQLPLHLMLYCGIRPAEVGRMDPQRDINWREKTVTIRSSSAKTGGGRVVPLRGLTPAKIRGWKPVTTLKHAPSHWRCFRRHAGFRHWVPDVLRHTFATYHAVHFRNLPMLQLEMGHRDLSLLRTRYVNPVTVHPRTARRFWQGKK